MIVGTSKPIHDAVAKATGRAVYAGDMVLPGMLHAAVLFSAIPHGIVTAIDTGKAMEVPGVHAVLHCFNTTDRLFNRYRFVKGMQVVDQECIFNKQVRYIGDRVACVVADTPGAAREAARLIDVTYEELPFTTDMGEAMAGKIDMIHPDGAVYGDFNVEIGDREKVARDAVETTTSSHLSRISHLAMEPHACVAAYDRDLGELTIWSPNQSVFGIRTSIGDLFELHYDRVRVIKTTMGGSFGSKQEWMLEPVAAAASMATGRPVRLVYSRGDTMVSTISRSPMDMTVTSKVTREGKLQSLDFDVTLDAGAYLGNSFDYACAPASKIFRCYSYPFAHYRARAVCTNSPVSGAFRGWSTPEIYIGIEHNLNMTARSIGMDPLEFRLMNVALPGDMDLRVGQPLGEIRTRECILLGRKSFGWDQRKAENEAFNRANPRYRRGIGIGCGGHVNGYFPRARDFAGVEMRMTESGSVIVGITLHDHGCGTVTAFKMMVAEAMELSMDEVNVREGDTAYTPFDVGCYASRTTYVLGRAAVDCAEKLKQRLREGIARLHDVDADSLEVTGGAIRSRNGGDLHYTYAQAAVAFINTLQIEPWVKHQFVNATNPGVTGSHFAHVEVDTYTGMVRILDYLAVHDIGQAINRGMCIAQIQGAVIMGSGAALSEHMHVNPQSGKPVSSLKDYHLLNAPLLPHIRVELVEDGGTEGPYGAKSIGEVCHVPVAPTIVGAVNDALGSDMCALPLYPDRIMELLAERRRSACN